MIHTTIRRSQDREPKDATELGVLSAREGACASSGMRKRADGAFLRVCYVTLPCEAAGAAVQKDGIGWLHEARRKARVSFRNLLSDGEDLAVGIGEKN